MIIGPRAVLSRWRRAGLSIRVKLLVTCLLLISVVVGVGVFSQLSQRRMGALGIDIYDRAFMAMSYLRSAQNALIKLGAGNPTQSGGADPQAVVSKAVQDIASDVRVAHDRAMSDEGERATRDLGIALDELGGRILSHDPVALQRTMADLQATFDNAVEVYAGDGYLYRRNVERLVDRSLQDTSLAVALSVAIASGVTLLLAASILPPLRRAVEIARAVSAGELDNAFPTGGSGETATLLDALALMQASLADKIGRIDALAEDAQFRAAELSIQSGRLAAALDNMRHGLCMVDQTGRTTVINRRLAEMFGQPEFGAPIAEWPTFRNLSQAFEGLPSFLEHLSDGRVIAINGQSVQAGGWVLTFEDVTESQRVEAQLRDLARTDALTGLPNRILFQERLHEALAGSHGPAVLCLDLDGFKDVNDTYGHGVGDDLLRSVAWRLAGTLPGSETIARLGGDEFAVILEAGDQLVAEARASALIECLRPPFELATRRVTIGASIGIAILRRDVAGEMAELATALLRNADFALYRAKAEGRGTYRVHSDEVEAAFTERREMEADLRLALERNELVLEYQPIVDAERGGVLAFEALLRWHHPDRGIVPPATFIPIAEEIGVISAFGRWVLRTACAEAATWPAEVKVAVNLSPLQFRHGFIVADVRRALADAALAPQRVELEITESALLHDDKAVLAALRQLHDLGIRISLDDFGVGYSSLSYLRKFPFDKIKIDRSFVQTMADNDSAAILQAIVSLGQTLKVTVVAEGVETVQQAEALRQVGCGELQGYLFGRPESGEVARQFIGRGTAPCPRKDNGWLMLG